MEAFPVEPEVTSVVCASSTETSIRLTVKIISDNTIVYVKNYFHILLGVLLASLGITSNILNIIVYWRQGVKDSVNITFIALSLWDMNICLMSGLSTACMAIDIYIPTPEVNVISIQYVYFGYTRGFMYVLSTLVTIYLSAERCICILLPFKVKEIFTSKRIVLVNLTIVAFGLACYCPAWATQGLQSVFNTSNNRSRVVLWLASNRRSIDVFVDTFNGMVLPVLAQLFITVCAIFMIHGIQKSASFRNKATEVEVSVKFSSNNKLTPDVSQLNPHKKHKIMTNKDLRIAKVVVLITTIFFACNLPVFVVAFLRLLIPDLDIGKPQQNLYSILYACVYMCGNINASANILVYYNVGTRYRHELLRLLGIIKFIMKKQ